MEEAEAASRRQVRGAGTADARTGTRACSECLRVYAGERCYFVPQKGMPGKRRSGFRSML